jgi:hypothetical protein
LCCRARFFRDGFGSAGLDVDKQTLVACCFTPGPRGNPQRELRTFTQRVPAMTHELLALVDWLTTKGITHVAMEATGEFVRRITVRAIPPTGRMGSKGTP